jgi:hypothetical protein
MTRLYPDSVSARGPSTASQTCARQAPNVHEEDPLRHSTAEARLNRDRHQACPPRSHAANQLAAAKGTP